MQPIICIYKIVSPSGAIYVGQTWDLCKRYRSGISPQQRMLYRSYVKYGADAHTKTILEQFDSDVTQQTLDIAEIKWIEFHKASGHRMLNIRGGGSRGKNAPESIEKAQAALRKWRQDNPDKAREITRNAAAANLGRKRSEETKRKMSESAKAKIFTPEHCAAIAAAKLGKPSAKRGVPLTPEQVEKNRIGHMNQGCKAVVQCDGSGNVIKEWDSAKRAAMELKLSAGSITRCAQNKPWYHTCGGFKWKYAS